MICRNRFWGAVLVGFGVGMLLSMAFSGLLLRLMLGLGAILLGLLIAQKR